MKKAFSKNITAWLFIVVFIVVLFAVLTSTVFLISIPQPFETIIRLGKELAALLFKTPLLPLILCILFEVDLIIYQWRLEDNSVKPLLNFCLLSANLLLCLTQINFSKNEILISGGLLLAFILIAVLGYCIKRKRVADRTSSPLGEDAEADNKLPGGSVYEIKQNYARSKAQSQLDFRVKEYQEKKSQELERLKKRNEIKLVKIDSRLSKETKRASVDKALEETTKKGKEKYNRIIAIIFNCFFWIIYSACIIVPFIAYSGVTNGSGESKIGNLLSLISKFFQPFSNKEPVIAIISALGGLFLWIIAIFLVVYLLVVIGRTIRKALIPTKSDSKAVSTAADELKVFTTGLIQSTLHIILVFPDFLLATLDLLFDVNPISEVINKWRNSDDDSEEEEKTKE